MLNDRGEAGILGLILLYLVSVIFALTMFMSGQGQIMGLEPYSFDNTYKLTNNLSNITTVEEMGGIVDAGEWLFVADTGLTSNDAGENRVLFSLEPDKNGGYTNEFMLNNPNRQNFDIFLKYYIVVGAIRYGTGYHFTPTGIIPFTTGFLGETQYPTIGYIDVAAQFEHPLINTRFYKAEGLPESGGNQAIEYTILEINDNEIHRFATVESWWSYPLSSVYYSGVQTTGAGLSITQYRRSYEPFIEDAFDWDNSVWGFIKTMAYITAWSLPKEYFENNAFSMWLFAIINVIAIKIPIVVLGYLMVRLGRGGG